MEIIYILYDTTPDQYKKFKKKECCQYLKFEKYINFKLLSLAVQEKI